MKSQEVIVIKALLENREQELNIANLSTLLHKDYKTTHTIIKRLERQKLLTLHQFGKSFRINLHLTAHPLVFEVEYARREEMLRDKNVKVMMDYFKNGLKTSLYIFLLFGSYANRKNTRHSDIDLFFITPDSDPEFEKKVLAIARLIPLQLHIQVFTETEFLAMKKSKETTVGSEIIKNNIILYGIESYYELLR